MGEIKVADYVADFLAERGIHTVFTVTGGGAMHLNDAFGHHSKISCIIIMSRLVLWQRRDIQDYQERLRRFV